MATTNSIPAEVVEWAVATTPGASISSHQYMVEVRDRDAGLRMLDRFESISGRATGSLQGIRTFSIANVVIWWRLGGDAL